MFELKPFDEIAKENNVEKIESTEALDKILPEQKKQFLKHFKTNGLIRTAAELIGVDQPKIYEWMDEDPDFKEQVNIARDQMLPMLEEAMFARALSGKSDLMLIFLAKSLKPEKYDEKSRESPKQAGITLQIVDVGGKSLTSGENVTIDVTPVKANSGEK